MVNISTDAARAFPGQIGYGTSKAALEALTRAIVPLGRVGEPEDIAGAVVFLASRQARWITGQVIQVAGGHAL
nr:SDR family oxidoreductase [Nonomuraea harbinensis]